MIPLVVYPVRIREWYSFIEDSQLSIQATADFITLSERLENMETALYVRKT